MTDARSGSAQGEDAFLGMARWPQARFDFRAGASPTARTLFQSTLKLLMRAFTSSQAEAAPQPGGLLCTNVG